MKNFHYLKVQHWGVPGSKPDTENTCWKCLWCLNLNLLFFFAIRGIQSNERKGRENILCFRSLLTAYRQMFTLGSFFRTFPLLQFLKKTKDAAVYFKKQVGNPSSEFKGLKCCSECDMTATWHDMIIYSAGPARITKRQNMTKHDMLWQHEWMIDYFWEIRAAPDLKFKMHCSIYFNLLKHACHIKKTHQTMVLCQSLESMPILWQSIDEGPKDCFHHMLWALWPAFHGALYVPAQHQLGECTSFCKNWSYRNRSLLRNGELCCIGTKFRLDLLFICPRWAKKGWPCKWNAQTSLEGWPLLKAVTLNSFRWTKTWAARRKIENTQLPSTFVPNSPTTPSLGFILA